MYGESQAAKLALKQVEEKLDLFQSDVQRAGDRAGVRQGVPGGGGRHQRQRLHQPRHPGGRHIHPRKFEEDFKIFGQSIQFLLVYSGHKLIQTKLSCSHEVCLFSRESFSSHKFCVLQP